ncbi:MAG: hypothetical protein KGL19_12395 [Bacteroidota bacterium]|nr:hypothetical protein [Bacteroidota bacterium]
MKETFGNKIYNDLEESRIDGKLIVAFIPIAFFTYFFHEFGHWTFGELWGNDMTLSLNNSTTRNGHFTNDSGALWSAIGGPFFTILQGLIFLLLTRLTTSIYTYSIAFFAVFSRFFSIVFGGIDLQDEARIASLTDTNKYLVAAIVLAILFLILWRCNRIMKLNLKASGYFLVLGVFAILIVIGADKIFR